MRGLSFAPPREITPLPIERNKDRMVSAAENVLDNRKYVSLFRGSLFRYNITQYKKFSFYFLRIKTQRYLTCRTPDIKFQN